MKVLTVRHPYAAAMFAHLLYPNPKGVLGPVFRAPLKKIETRSRPTKLRGTIAIHAAKSMTRREGYLAEDYFPMGGIGRLAPFGHIIGLIDIVDCVPVETLTGISVTERRLGDYAPGRFGYILENPRLLPKPIPAKGQLGFWNWEAPK